MPNELASASVQRQLDRRVIALVVAGFLAVLAAGVAAGLVIRQAQDEASWVTHTYQVERALIGTELNVERMRAAFTTVGTSSPAYREARGAVLASADSVARLTADNPLQRARMPGLRALEAGLDRDFSGGTSGSVDADYGRFSATIGAMFREEERLLRSRTDARRASVRLFWVVLAITGALLVAVAAASVLVIRRYTGDLAQSRNALQRLNAGLEDAVRDRTVDLRRANDEIQRFAYIVSHDLRSPLVNVMGFTAEIDALAKPLRALIERLDARSPDLVDQASRAAVFEDLPESTGFIRSSTQKMDRLINAILRLSREGRRTLTPEPVDLNAIVEGAIASVRHRLDERGARATVSGTLPTVTGDRLAIEQIVSNLIDNAVKYFQRGRPGRIEVSAAAVGDRVRLLVADNGRGIDPRDHDRVFDLFRRSGQQDQPGEGIGLAHVRASAYRLGGWIELQSELDRGATFTLNLPSTQAEQRAEPA